MVVGTSFSVSVVVVFLLVVTIIGVCVSVSAVLFGVIAFLLTSAIFRAVCRIGATFCCG